MPHGLENCLHQVWEQPKVSHVGVTMHSVSAWAELRSTQGLLLAGSCQTLPWPELLLQNSSPRQAPDTG